MSDLNGHLNLLKKVSGYFQKFFFCYARVTEVKG